MPRENAVFVEVRRKEIINTVNKYGQVTVKELCDQFDVSPATIRTDLAELEAEHRLKRTHGGAIRYDNQSEHEPTSYEKIDKFVNRKKSIARAAVDYICPGDIIILDTGTTILELAKLIVNIENLTVVTNDLVIASYLEANSDVTVILIGGTVRKYFHCTIGECVIDALDDLRVDTLFLATNGVDIERGLSTPNMEMARIKNKLIQISSKTILLADSSKIGDNTLAVFGKMEDVDIMVTDSCVEESFLQSAKDKNINVICV